MVPKTASKSDQTALSHRSREVGTQRIAISRSMAMLGRATLLSGPDDLPAGQERGRSLEAARLAVPPRGEGRGRKDARSGWGGAWHDPRLASRMEGWHTMRPNMLRLARRGAGRAATPPGALWLEVCPPRPSIPATRRDVGGWWVSPRVSSLPGGALVAAERDRLNGTCSHASFCKFDPGDERQRSSLRNQEMSYCPQRCPKIPRQQFLAANSAGSGTSAPTRPERQENAAGMAVDTQLEAWTTRVPPKVDLGGPAAALCWKEH